MNWRELVIFVQGIPVKVTCWLHVNGDECIYICSINALTQHFKRSLRIFFPLFYLGSLTQIFTLVLSDLISNLLSSYQSIQRKRKFTKKLLLQIILIFVNLEIKYAYYNVMKLFFSVQLDFCTYFVLIKKFLQFGKYFTFINNTQTQIYCIHRDIYVFVYEFSIKSFSRLLFYIC